MLEVRQLPVLSDNYVYLIREPGSGEAAIVDPAVAQPVREAVEALGWRIVKILNTHHHNDHTGGNEELKQLYGCPVVGPKADRARIPALDVAVEEGDRVSLGGEEAQVLFTPGHTRGHISFFFPESKALFCGDTLFALGCGRLFEGTAADMWSSLAKYLPLPTDTQVYCAHEYTLSNARFALTIEPENQALVERARAIEAAREAGQPTVPSTLAEELATNPFLRADTPEVAAAVGLGGHPPAEVLGEVRRRKDNF